jgi:hypothetical protein
MYDTGLSGWLSAERNTLPSGLPDWRHLHHRMLHPGAPIAAAKIRYSWS